MNIEHAVREALSDLAADTLPVDGLAASALRRARRRQHAVRTAIAGTAAVVTIPFGVAVLHNPGSGTSIDPTTSRPAAGPTTVEPDPTEPGVIPAPPTRELSADELTAAFETCSFSVDGLGDVGYDGWEPVFGITIDDEVDRGVPTTWVAARRGDDYRADCALDSSSRQVGGGGVYGLKSTPDLLYALVDGQEGVGVGRYVDPVARVTVQYDDESEREAVLRGGFWFLPIDGQRAYVQYSEEGASPEVVQQLAEAEFGGMDLVGVPLGYTFRGYDADGQLVYASSTDGPSVEDCYADPTGTEIVGNGAGHSDPSECIPTHQWQPLP